MVPLAHRRRIESAVWNAAARLARAFPAHMETLCFSEGRMTRQEGGAGRTGGTAKSG